MGDPAYKGRGRLFASLNCYSTNPDLLKPVLKKNIRKNLEVKDGTLKILIGIKGAPVEHAESTST